MNAEVLNALQYVINYYCITNWEKIVNFYGEEQALELDFTRKFPYEEIYEKGDLKECEVFFHIATIQRMLISALYDVMENSEAMVTFHYVQLMSYKLFDASTGTKQHLWLN